MDDLISRQAAIDAMAELQGRASAKGVLIGIHRAWEAIKTLPTAQPDIIRCRNCKFCKFASGDSRICMKFGHSPIGELDFCAWAERRTDG